MLVVTSPSHLAVVGAGANLGSREACIRAAIRLLRATAGCTIEAVSRVFETEAIGPPQPRYFNCALRIRCRMSCDELLAVLLDIERSLGRERRERWGPRSLDLDLLWSGQGRRSRAELTLPHPRLTERAFALAPLLEVVPELATQYAGRLEQLGGPPTSAWPLCALPMSSGAGGWRQLAFGRELATEAWGRDVDDALAFACAALGSSFARRPLRRVGRVRREQVRQVSVRSSEPAALAQRVLEACEDGLAPSHVAIVRSARGTCHARLVGCSAGRSLVCRRVLGVHLRDYGGTGYAMVRVDGT